MVPLGSAWRFAAGVQHAVSQSVELGLAYELLWGGNLPIDQQRGLLSGRIAGTYQDTLINFLGLNVNWKL